MKIEFVRSGGLAGLRLALTLDTVDLPAHEASQLIQMVESARDVVRGAPRSRPEPDGFQYDLTIESQAGGRETHRLCEPDVPDGARALIERLTAMARRR